jgi:undecaprenyl-diphosphatase
MSKAHRSSTRRSERPAHERVWQRLRGRLKPTQRRELTMLVLAALIAGLLWCFVELADEVVEAETAHLDEKIILAMRNPADRSDPIGAEWVEELARDVTALGGTGVLAFLSIAVAGFLLLGRRARTVLLLMAAVGGGLIVSTLLKHGFSRPRPDLVPHGSYVYTSSFPSGHSMMAAITYLTLAVLLMRTQSRRSVKMYLLLLATMLTVCVGASRVYLGVHWPTDVLAGWTLGAAWAIGCWLVALWLQRRGVVEPEPAPSGEASASSAP